MRYYYWFDYIFNKKYKFNNNYGKINILIINTHLIKLVLKRLHKKKYIIKAIGLN